jgi:hypothetical protein
MTIETEEVETSADMKYCHQFHAEAHALSGDLRSPIKQTIEPHVPIELNDERGGHLTRFTEDVNIEGLISFKRAHTRVSGSKSLKHAAWITLSTTIVEGLNVFEVVTVDRVVAQVSTEHAFKDGHVPRVTFLGTKFENLQVCGIPVRPRFNFGICGNKPDKDASYLSRTSFLNETRKRMQEIVDSGFLFGQAKEQYDQRLATIKSLNSAGVGSITCSLVESIDISELRKQLPGVETVGHVIVIPDFGAVSLGEVEVGVELPKPSKAAGRQVCGSSNGGPRMSNYFEVTMVNFELGCVGNASLQAAKSKTNGTTSP